MSYCPECGSEVAQTDTFCAYCGISLQVMTEQPVSETAPPDNSPIFGEPETIQTSASLNKEPMTPSEIQAGKIEDPLPTQPPTPSILEGAPVIEPEKIAPDSGEVSFTNPFAEGNLDEPAEKTADYNLPTSGPPVAEKISGDSTGITAAENALSSEVKTVPPVPSIESENADTGNSSGAVGSESNFGTVPVDEFSQTIPYSPADYPKQDLAIPEMPATAAATDDEERLKSVLDEIDLNLQAETRSDGQPTSASAIEDPAAADELTSVPAESTTSTEKEIQAVEPAVDLAPVIEDLQTAEPSIPVATQAEGTSSTAVSEAIPIEASSPVAEIPVSVVRPAEDVVAESAAIEEYAKPEVVAPPAPPVSSSPGSEDLDKESRSYTNPNIANGDTGGRSKKKLKPLEEGTVLNSRYEVIRKIGGGGMGAVYLANDKNLGGVLRAVKEMVQSYIEDEAQEKAINDFKRESLLLTSLEHPGIPTIYDYFFDEKEGRFYLVMKYISGGDLAARLRAAPEGRIDEVSVTDWAIQIADVLDYLHNRQPPIVYRDLKPSNIMIDGNTGKVMIIDFGIARWVNKEEKGVTAVGTMGYAPPELFSGNVEPRSDLYSLGSTMFHLLTGADPQSNPLLIFDFNKNPRPRQINPNLSDQMEQILMRAVEYNSEQRFSSAAEMRDELVKHLENLKKGAITFGVISNVVSGQSLSNVPVFCGFCGQKIVATDMFCPFCGAQQPLVGQSQKLKATSPAYLAPSVTAKLLIVGTNDLEHTEYPLEKESNLLGRRDPMSNIFPEVDMSKFDPQTKISRKHARIWREGDLYMLEDLGSSNGTILINSNNDAVRLLPRQPHVLSHGDKLKLGDTTLRFTIG
jgi:serine/threonine protein kinase